MRRMYSEQELTKVIKAVFDEEVESGALDDKIKEYAEDWLEENPLEPSDLDFSNIDFVAKTLTQSQANNQYDNNFTTAIAGLTIGNIFNRIQIVNGIMYFITNFKLTNNSGSSVNITSGALLGSNNLTMSASIAEKIYDLLGNQVSDAIANATKIAGAVGLASKNADTDSSYEYRPYITILNSQSANTIRTYVKSSEAITLDNGEVLYVTARIALSLL